MSIGSMMAVYFITWWVTLFTVLPWGVRNSHEAGEAVLEGNEAGAPVNAMMWRKVGITTAIATVIFLLIYGQVTYGWIGFEDIPFLNSMPN